MSALTDLFSALANKIRSKTGGSDTYTPPEMVAAIDDVYDAGVAAGTTPTQTKTVTAGTSATTVTPDQGYALSSVTVNPTPSQSKSASPNVSTNKTVSPDDGNLLSSVTITPLSHTATYTPAANTAANDMGEYHDKRYVNTSGMIVPSGDKAITANGSGIDVKSFSTVSVNVPSPTLSGDAATSNVLSGKTFYNNTYTKQTGTMTNQGSPTRTIPAGGSSYFSAGYYSGGYVYAGSSTPSQYSTTLWTNSSPSSEFGSKTLSLGTWTGYDYLKITWRGSSSNTTTWTDTYSVSDLINSMGSSNIGMAAGVYYSSAGNLFTRRFYYYSSTQLSFAGCRRCSVSSSASATVNTAVIPTKIEGIIWS